MSDVFESYEKHVKPTIPKPETPPPVSEDELFHEDESTGDAKGGGFEIDYEKLASMVAEKMKGGAPADGDRGDNPTDNQ